MVTVAEETTNLQSIRKVTAEQHYDFIILEFSLQNLHPLFTSYQQDQFCFQQGQ